MTLESLNHLIDLIGGLPGDGRVWLLVVLLAAYLKKSRKPTFVSWW